MNPAVWGPNVLLLYEAGGTDRKVGLFFLSGNKHENLLDDISMGGFQGMNHVGVSRFMPGFEMSSTDRSHDIHLQ
jgi:hypothetical protein